MRQSDGRLDVDVTGARAKEDETDKAGTRGDGRFEHWLCLDAANLDARRHGWPLLPPMSVRLADPSTQHRRRHHRPRRQGDVVWLP